MANQEALIAEYTVLKQDISQALQKRMQLVGAALAVGSAFVVYGFQAQNSPAFLATLFILLAASYYSALNTRDVISVVTYLIAIIEPKVEGLQWETMLEERSKSEFSLSLRLSDPIILGIVALLSIGCVFFAWLFLKDYRILNVLVYGCITVIFGVSFILSSIFNLRVSSRKYRSDSLSRWKKVEKELSPAVTAIRVNS